MHETNIANRLLDPDLDYQEMCGVLLHAIVQQRLMLRDFEDRVRNELQVILDVAYLMPSAGQEAISLSVHSLTTTLRHMRPDVLLSHDLREEEEQHGLRQLQLGPGKDSPRNEVHRQSSRA